MHRNKHYYYLIMNGKVMMLIIMCKCKQYVKYAIKVVTKHLHDDLTYTFWCASYPWEMMGGAMTLLHLKSFRWCKTQLNSLAKYKTIVFIKKHYLFRQSKMYVCTAENSYTGKWWKYKTFYWTDYWSVLGYQTGINWGKTQVSICDCALHYWVCFNEVVVRPSSSIDELGTAFQRIFCVPRPAPTNLRSTDAISKLVQLDHTPLTTV